MAQKSGVKLVAKNPKAYHEYYIVEKFEAGVELFGTEVKSIRAGKLSLKGFVSWRTRPFPRCLLR